MAKTDSQLITEANIIKNETTAGANTATRVGTMLDDIIENKINNDKIVTTVGSGSDDNVPSDLAVETALSGKQDTLVSGTNIKTINGQDVLGSGNLTVTYDKGYIEFRSRLAQSGTSAPSKQITFIDEITNDLVSPTDPLFKSLSFTREGTGNFRFIITSNEANPINPNNCDVSFSDGKIRAIGTSSSVSSPFQFAVFTFNSYQPDGTLADSVISFSNIYVRVYS